VSFRTKDEVEQHLLQRGFDKQFIKQKRLAAKEMVVDDGDGDLSEGPGADHDDGGYTNILISSLISGAVNGKMRSQMSVAEPTPLELFRLKCTSHRYAGDTNSTHFKRNNPLVYRVTARCNHGYTGSR
jgi:hypothetical protein